jgi:bacteriorhodopsin
MPYQTMSLHNEALPPTKPAFQVDDKKAFTIGAWAGVCFALALLSAATVILVRSPDTRKPDEHAWAPTITLPSRN